MRLFTFFLALLMLSTASFASVVRVQRTAEGWRLERDGAPYFVKGACVWGDDARGWFADLDSLHAAGANSARTYWAGDAQSTLDRAQKLGMTVTLGLEVDRPRHGANFFDEKTIEIQENRVRAQVEKYHDHPALLAWGIGNEVELLQSDNQAHAQTFRVLNRLARLVKSLDPNHPTMIVVAGMDERNAAQIQQFCPDVDIIGINIYNGLKTLSALLDKWNFQRPTLITEWGPVGHWETKKTAWNAPIEPTSTQKAAQFQAAYEGGIAGDARRCLGSYAFIWGHKQEATATWLGLFLKSGERLGAQDTLQQLWTGRTPEFPCPAISPIQITGEKFQPGALIEVAVKVSSVRPTQIEWLLARESDDRKDGGDAERAPEFFKTGIVPIGENKAQITLPAREGAYRIFVFARDDKNGAATANAPIWLERALPAAPQAPF